jgi:dienelactone hydrolase
MLAFAAACLIGSARAEETPKGENVSFKTADGLTIAATYWPPFGASGPAPVVIALPMYKQTRASYAPMVGPVTDRGMGLLALDLRGHGDSAKQGDDDLSKKVGARDATLFNAMHADVEAAIAWLAKEKKTPKGKIGLLGASVGCSVAIDAAVRVPDEIAAVVCLTPGKAYLGVPTMEHVAAWRKGLPLLLVSSEAEAGNGADAIEGKLDGKGAELKLVKAFDPSAAAKPMDLHGTNMFGKVADVERSIADWMAYRLAFHRIDLPGGFTAVLGGCGEELYVGVLVPDGFKGSLSAFRVRVGKGGVTDPWSDTTTLDFVESLDEPSSRHRTRVRREYVNAQPGKPFAVQVSLDGKRFLPEAGAPPLLITLK